MRLSPIHENWRHERFLRPFLHQVPVIGVLCYDDTASVEALVRRARDLGGETSPTLITRASGGRVIQL